MAVSISKAQAKALANGLIDNLGANKSDFEPVETFGKMIEVAGLFAATAVDNLNKADRVASAALADSIRVLDPIVSNNSFRIDIEMLYYGRFINEGVKGTKGGVGTYSFKNNYVGKNMRNEIRKWLIKEGLKITKTKKYTAISKREVKRKSISETSDRVAFAIARSIKQKGIKRTNFLTNAGQSIQQSAISELGASFSIDVINSLPKNIKDA